MLLLALPPSPDAHLGDEVDVWQVIDSTVTDLGDRWQSVKPKSAGASTRRTACVLDEQKNDAEDDCEVVESSAPVAADILTPRHDAVHSMSEARTPTMPVSSAHLCTCRLTSFAHRGETGCRAELVVLGHVGPQPGAPLRIP